MLLNLIVFKFVPGILKCLDAWWMSFFVFLFSIVNLYSHIYKKLALLQQVKSLALIAKTNPYFFSVCILVVLNATGMEIEYRLANL